MNFTSYSVVDLFEKTIADFAGSKYAVAVESCCFALFLSCKYLKVKKARIPDYTYPGVACSIINSGAKVEFGGEWEGNIYSLMPHYIYDSALRFEKNMYIPKSLYCLSFHLKKPLGIGRGGMILCDDKKEYEWFKRARFDGRGEKPLDKDKITMVGWNGYMTPEQAARGLMIFDLIKNKRINIDWKTQNYPNLTKINAYK